MQILVMNFCILFFFHPYKSKKLQRLHEGSSAYELSDLRTNSVRKVLCNPLANRPCRDVLAEKIECYIGMHDSQ